MGQIANAHVQLMYCRRPISEGEQVCVPSHVREFCHPLPYNLAKTNLWANIRAGIMPKVRPPLLVNLVRALGVEFCIWNFHLL